MRARSIVLLLAFGGCDGGRSPRLVSADLSVDSDRFLTVAPGFARYASTSATEGVLGASGRATFTADPSRKVATPAITSAVLAREDLAASAAETRRRLSEIAASRRLDETFRMPALGCSPRSLDQVFPNRGVFSWLLRVAARPDAPVIVYCPIYASSNQPRWRSVIIDRKDGDGPGLRAVVDFELWAVSLASGERRILAHSSNDDGPDAKNAQISVPFAYTFDFEREYYMARVTLRSDFKRPGEEEDIPAHFIGFALVEGAP